MAVSMTTLTGPIYLPDGSTPLGGRVSLELSSWDREAGEALLISGPIYETIDENGQFSLSVFTTTEGENGVHYKMFVIWEDSTLSESYVNGIYVGTPTPHYTKKYIGSFSLSGDGPFKVSDLNIVSELTANSFDVYLECQAYAANAATSVDLAAQIASDSEASAVAAASSAAALVAQNRLAAVDLATTTNIALTGSQTIDGVVSSTKRILVKDQTNPTENGIYVASAGAWTRASDADTSIKVAYAYVGVISGLTNSGKHFQVVNAPILGTGPIVFRRLGEVADVISAVAVETAARTEVINDMTTSGPFTSASIDSHGYVFRIEWSEGDVSFPNIQSTSDTSLTVNFANLDSDGYALSGELQWFDGTNWPTTYQQNSQMPLGDLLIKAGYGQSVSTGSGEGGLSITPIAGLRMFAEGDWLDDAGWAAPPTFSTVVSHVSASDREPWARGSAESQAQFYFSLMNHDLKSGGGILSLNVARGEKTALELSEGGLYFSRFEAFLTAAANYAVSNGFAPSIGPLPFVHGEADISSGTSGIGYIEQVETGIRLPYEAVVQATIDPTYQCTMMLTQVASAAYYNRHDSEIALAQLRMCMERPDRYAFAGPMYQYLYGGLGGAGSHLNGAVENKWAAAMMGRAEAYILAHKPVPYIKPLTASKRGKRSVVVSFDVPTSPLVMDSVSVSDPGNMGFKLFRLDTGVELGISSVSVVGGTNVKIVTDSNLPASKIRVAYAQHGGVYDDADADSFGSVTGRLTGNRGCLRDSTSDAFVISGVSKPLWHWTPIFELNTGA